MARDFQTIGVIGLGTMGAGITEVFARSGFSVVGVEIDEEAVQRGRQHLENSTARAVARGKLTESEHDELLGRVSYATSLEALEAAGVLELSPPTIGEGETLADLLADRAAYEDFDVDGVAARGFGFVRLNQLALEHALGAR